MKANPAASLDVIGIGLATVDILIRLDELPAWNRGGRFDDIALDGGGPVGTALVAASRLGLSCGYIGTAGDDEIASRKLASLRNNGVDASRVKIRPGPERSVIVCYVQSSTGERIFAGRRGMGDNPLLASEIDRDYLVLAQFLHLDGCYPDAALQAARWMREAGRTVIFDGASTNGTVGESHRKILEFVDVLICGQGYLRALTGITDVFDAGRAVIDRGMQIVAETHGAEGCFTVTKDGRFHTPAFPVCVVDTTGAGDVLHGAFIAGLKRGWELPDIVRYASAAAAINCTHFGGRRGIPTHDAIMAFLEQQSKCRKE